MSRAVFLSAGGDPYIAMLVIKLWQERWYNEIDRFYIDYNNHAGVPTPVVQEFCSRVMADPKVHLIAHPQGIGNGMPITEMTLISKEDTVMLLEDDGFIFEPGHVASNFELIEKGHYDAIGSPRGSCGTEVWDASKTKYNLDYSGYGDVGPNFWPNFFFCKREDLLKTDMNFASKKFGKGEYFKELDHTFVEDNYGDTFVWTCVQLRAMGLRFKDIPQFHADPNEIENKRSELQNWLNTKPYWLHGGSLSSGLSGYLSGQVPDVSTDSAKMEIETRVAFWIIALDTIKGFDDFKPTYDAGIDKLVQNAQLNTERIGQKIKIYRDLMRL